MSSSPLVSYTRISPNSSARTAKIDTITIHHMASTGLSIEACGAVFASTSRQASSNYGVGTDGRIALYVDESRRSWCSSNRQNDNRAVTIEVQNDSGEPQWHISEAALEATIALCTDICIRNNIPRLNFTGDASGNLTMHCWFASTACPGPYLKGKFSFIAQEVNRRLGADVFESGTTLRVGDVITLMPGTRYSTGKVVPDWVMKKTLYCRGIHGCNVAFSILQSGAVTGVTSLANVRKDGQAVAGEAVDEKAAAFQAGDVVRLKKDAQYVSGKRIPGWVTNQTVYVRKVYSNGNIVFSIFRSGAVTGVTTQDCLEKMQGGE